MTTSTGNSRFLAYLEQRRSLTASQSASIAKHLREYETRKADIEAELCRTQPSTSTRAAVATSAAFSAAAALDSGDEEQKETILSSASTLSTASSGSDLSPLASLPAISPSAASSQSASYAPVPPSSLLHRELVDMRLRLQRAEDEHMNERKRWEQQRAAERREAEEWKRRAEEKREREEEREEERSRLRSERDEWHDDRLVMQQELDRLNVYFQQLSSSPTNAASSSLSSALSIVAVAKDREENNRLRRKNNRLIDAVNHKQADCDALASQLAQLAQWKQQHEQHSTEHVLERTKLQQQVDQLTSEVARLKKAESEWQQKQSERRDTERARLQYAEKEAKYKRREEEYKQSIERLTQLAADRKNVNTELEWMKDKTSQLENSEQQLTAQCVQWKEKVDDADRRTEEQRVECRQWQEQCSIVERRLEVAMQQLSSSDGVGSGVNSELTKRADEKVQMEERLTKLEHERAVLEQLLRKERETMASASTTHSVKAAAIAALDAFVPVASPVSSKAAASASPTNTAAASSEPATFARPLPSPAKRDTRNTIQHSATLPSAIGSSQSPSASFFRQGRRASLPAPQQLTHSTTQPLPSPVHRSALKMPVKAVHPNPFQQSIDTSVSTGVSSSSPRSMSPSSSLTSSGGSVHRVRFASPLTVTAGEDGSTLGLGVLTTRDDNSLRQQPDTPARSRLKQLVLGFF